VREWNWVEGFSSFNVLSRRRVRARVGHPSTICNALKLKWLHGALAWRWPEEMLADPNFSERIVRGCGASRPWVRITPQHPRPALH
jgi:hypothetical protein